VTSDEKLEAYQRALAAAIRSEEGAGAMFAAMRRKNSDPAKLLTAVEACLRANEVDPDAVELEPPAPAAPAEPEPEAADEPELERAAPAGGHEERDARASKNWKRGAVRAPWRRKTRGEPDRTIYPRGGFNLVIRVIDGEIRAAMSKTVLLAYLVCCEEADVCGQFEIPAGQLGERVGCNRRNAQNALTTLLTAGVIRVVYPGGPKTPNVYSLVPAEKFDREHALEVFRQARQSAAARIMRTTKALSAQPA
jgi:hypothetical protein